MTHLAGHEIEQPVLDDRTTHAARKLVLGEPLPETGTALLLVGPLEPGIAKIIIERPCDIVGAATGGGLHQPSGELAARDIVGVRHDASIAHRFLRHGARLECETVECHSVLLGALDRKSTRLKSSRLVIS